MVLDVVDACELVLVHHLVYGFTLLRYVDLVLVCMACYLFEQVVNIFEAARTRLYVGHCLARVYPVGKYLLLVNLARVIVGAKVTLISNYDYGHIWLLFVALTVIIVIILRRNAIQEVVAPLVDALVAIDARQVEHDNAAVSASVEAVAQALEALLTSCVPYLQRYNISVFYFDFLFYEICPNRSFLGQT